MSALDLSGSIIVLTHARTGSSLLMQTLRLLGADVVGIAERADLPHSANPKGFFENIEILGQGLHAPVLTAQPDLLRGRAVKLALRPLARRRSAEEWAALTGRAVVLLLPIRHPAESLRSRRVLLRSADTPTLVAQFHASARNMLLDFAFLADRVCAPEFGRPAPPCIDYRQVVLDPSGYVAGVAAAAALCPSSAQVAAATANIDGALYRVRADDEAVREMSAGVRPLARIYDLLRGSDPSKWSRVRSECPSWTLGSPSD